MTTTRTLHRAVLTTVVAGTAVLAAAPAYAATLPAKPGPISYGSLQSDSAPTKAQVEHTERATGNDPAVLFNKAQIERNERATLDQQPATGTRPVHPSDSSGSPVPGTVLALLGAAAAAGAGGVVVYRFRHHGSVGAATA